MTRRGDCRKWTEEDLLAFRLEQQVEEQHAPEVKKGKQRAHHASDTGKYRKPKGPTPVPSPDSELAALQVLNLGSGGLLRSRCKAYKFFIPT